ncbi:unnamed protein product [Paramecium pentaurelia]|uniref:Uncharacterized protein n=1 Tax=Paramecium pentaurelia TaxID=43138 RepID=A0A8S1V038_9CILI|nr:unnamed protein product [Paramecium pentaurelia]
MKKLANPFRLISHNAIILTNNIILTILSGTFSQTRLQFNQENKDFKIDNQIINFIFLLIKMLFQDQKYIVIQQICSNMLPNHHSKLLPSSQNTQLSTQTISNAKQKII